MTAQSYADRHPDAVESSDVHALQRLALRGMSSQQNGHSFVTTSAGAAKRASAPFTILPTTMKSTSVEDVACEVPVLEDHVVLRVLRVMQDQPAFAPVAARKQQRHDGHDHVLHERRHDLAERAADDDADGEIHHVALECERLEVGEKRHGLSY